MNLSLTPERRAKYVELWTSAVVKSSPEVPVNIQRVTAGAARYQAIAARVNIPWQVIGAIHSMESGCDFNTHLHNGDPLTSRTYHVPRGRPRTGNPPFNWEISALDALDERKGWTDWSISGTLYFLECYNGLGYMARGMNSPYLWSYTNAYTQGYFVSDGNFSSTTVSKQVGCVPILKGLGYSSGIVEPSNTLPAPLVRYGTHDDKVALELQRFLNKTTGANLLEDGWPGRYTSDAFFRAFGVYLFGDPRNLTN